FLREIVADYGLHMIALRTRPFEIGELSQGALDEYLLGDSPSKRLQFTLKDPVLPVAHELEFADKNPDSLRLDVGTLGRDGLRESWLSARTEDPSAIATWKKVARKLKEMTVQGATAINPKTGATGPAKGHRFSEGAAKLQATGVPMLTVT